MDEDLIEGFDNFVIGNFGQCLALSQRANPSSDFTRFLWTSLTARCHLALNHMEKIKELKQRSEPGLQGTAYFAVLLKSSQETQRKAAFEKVIENANSSNGEAVSCYYSCVARALGGDLVDAIHYAKAVAASSPSEFNALRIQFSLAINRPDLAEKILKTEAVTDDSAAAKLVSAIHSLITGNPEDACMGYSDLVAQFGAENSLSLVNGRAVGNVLRGQYGEAQEDLEAVLSVHEDDADSIRNFITCLTWQGKSSEAREQLSKLQAIHPHHKLISDMSRVQGAFAQFAS
jgi:tetratricopeptide (TPR) repeat protein